MTQPSSELLFKANPLADLDQWARKYLWLQLRELGLFRDASAWSEQVDTLRIRLGVLDRYTRWWRECCIEMLEAAGYVRQHNGMVQLIDPALLGDRAADAAFAASWQARKALYLQDPQARAVVELLDECLRRLPDILTGRVSATDIIFPGASLHKVEGIYKHNERSDYFNKQLASAAKAYVGLLVSQRPDTRIRILEIGAGTGGTTATVLPELDGFDYHLQEYCYTDVSNAFLIHGRTEYAVGRPFLRCKRLDIEAPPAEQEIELGAYDIVIATNVLHATRNIRQTLRNTKALLKKNGILLLNELIEKSTIGTLTFGLLDGWWRYEDDALRIPGSPLLDVAQWQAVLGEEGFGSLFIPEEKAARLGQQLMVAESDGIIRQPVSQSSTSPSLAQSAPTMVRESVSATPADPAAVPGKAAFAGGISKAQVEALVTEALADALKVSPETLKTDVPFADYGVDSILGVTFISKLQEALAIPLNASVIFDQPTVERLAKYVLQHHREQVQALLAGDSEPQPDDPAVVSDPTPVQGSEPPAIVDQTLEDADRSVQSTAGLDATHALRAGVAPHGSAVPDAIAVIGMAGQFPEAEDTDHFWRNLIEGLDGVVELPSEYLDRDRYFDQTRQPGKTYCKWGGILRDKASFDPLFFALSPREAESMNPHQRLILQESWKGLEDAGYNPKTLSDLQVGVFVGAEPIRYASSNFTGASEALVASRISYYLNLKGPALVVNTGCSSSAVAIHLACESLRNGETDMALAGGVHAGLDPLALITTSEIEMLSPRGRCHTLDASGDGTVLSEGVGMVVLKRLQDAIADRDHIHGVITASGINQDGASNGITAPNGAAQEELISRTYHRFKIDPATIEYVELHGTGTRLGDPVEANALIRAFKAFTAAENFCGLGSAKSHIGHTSAAAGVIGLIKVLLSMKHAQLPGLMHFKDLNPLIDLKGSAFNVVTDIRPWTARSGARRRAALNSFGHSGTNVHLVIEDYPQPPAPQGQTPALVPLSAATAEQLKDYALKLREFIGRGELRPGDLQRIAHTLQTGRQALRYRVIFQVSSLADLAKQLAHFADAGTAGGDSLHADIKNLPDDLMAISLDADTPEMIQNRIRNGELMHLARHWVAGQAVDWSLLHQTPPHRIPLPTYPFARQAYWASAQTPLPAPAGPGMLHPLLHRDLSEAGRHRYRSNFNGREFFLADHTIQGRIILPGVAHLELVRAAVERIMGTPSQDACLKLENVVWIQPIVVDSPAQIDVLLTPAQAGRLDFEIVGQDAARGVLHCRGRATIAVGQAPERPRPVAQLMQPAGIGIDAFYAAFRKADIVHGPSYRGVTGLYRQGEHVLAELILPAGVAASQHEYVLHPSMMESALQAASLLIAERHQHAGGPSLPFALETLEIYGPCVSQMYAWIRYSPHYPQDGKVIKLDIDLADAAGRVAVRLAGFSFRRIAEDVPPAEQTSEPGTRLMFVPTWHPLPSPLDGPAAEYAQRHVVLCDVPQATCEALRSSMPDAKFLHLSQSSVNPAERYTHHALACFALVQSVLADKPQGRVLVQVVAPDDGQGRLLAGLSGLLKTAALERPAFCGQIVLATGNADAAELALQLQQAARLPQERVFAHRQGRTLVRGWEQVQTKTDPIPGVFKEYGRYLVTGGAGGIGLIVVREILRQSSHARVIVTGRSMLASETLAELRALQRQFRAVDYVQADVSHAEQVNALIATHGPFDGIVHAAGITEDAPIAGKAASGFEQVLAAKVAGAVNLDEATRHHDLDFLVLFSSISAVFGNPGQADYATGNAFMDAFAQWRDELAFRGERAGHTLSLNWPLWEAGGLQISVTGKALMSQTMGALPLPTSEGLIAFSDALVARHTQAMVLYGAPQKLAQFVLRAGSPPALSDDAPTDAAQMSTDTTDLTGAIRDLIANEVALAIKLAVDKLELDVEFSQYGFDSIFLMDFVRDLNRKYGLDLMPTVFFEYSTIATLALYLDQHYRDVLAPHLSNGSVATPAAAGVMREADPVAATSAAPVAIAVDTVQAAGRPGGFQDMAIIGMDGLFPEAASVEAFWQVIAGGKDLIKEIPTDHWDCAPWYDEKREVANKTYCKWGSFVDGVDRFDAEFFNISPVEAEWMDPQMRLFLQSTYRCAENAGRINEVRGSNTGVFVGVCSHDYIDRIAERAGPINPHQGVGTAQTVIANRVSFLLDLTGPSLSFNTACSASLVALHEACHSLHRRECSMAFVGGVNLLLSSHHYRYFSSIGALSPSGRCYSFDSRADGYVPGETIASILLKPLSEAIRDGDRVYAVIKGSAALHGGFTPSITAPSISGEKNVIVAAWKNAGIDPATLGYIEAHGTGTKLGDPIEVSALTQAFQEFTPLTGFCALGSAKAHLGHTEGSAGIVGVIKVVQQLRHKQIPAMPLYEAQNPYIQLEKSALYINRDTIPWPSPVDQPRRAGISSFGFSGVYAHVVLEEYVGPPSTERAPTQQRGGPHLIVLSAKNPERLHAKIGDLLDFVVDNPAAAPADIAYTLQVGREAMKHRLAFVATSREALLQQLRALNSGQIPLDGVFQGEARGRLSDLAERVEAADLDRLIADWTVPAAASRLLTLWVKGQPIDWRALHGKDAPQRIALPLYPFGGQRHWLEPVPLPVTTQAAVVTAAANSPATAMPTPLPLAPSMPGNGDLKRHTLAELTRMVSETTKTPAHRIDAQSDLEELGLDSILIAALNKKLESWTGVHDSTLFFKYKDLSSLAEFLSTQHGAKLSGGASPATVAEVSAATANIAETRTLASVGAVPPFTPDAAAEDDIAIIGISGRYPGTNDMDSLWQNLCRGQDSISEIPEHRFDYRPLFDPEKGKAGKIYCKWGGFIEGADQFDAGFFKVSPQDARFMDPQERIFLETAWECLEKAGQIRGDWQRDARNIGVFAGVTFNSYQLIMAEAAERHGDAAYLANSQTFSIANRVSYFFNFTGPSFTVDTACSSSLMAVHLACESIKRGECELALAGGVNLSLHQSKYLTLCATGFASSDGRCHAFAANGDGYVPSEGVGAVVLKPLARALADGDPVLAIIKGTGVSHDGKTRGYTVPNPVAQSKAIEAALRQARISPDQISYVEAHGTGTALGDPIEIQGLMDVYSRYTERKQYCAIGSVKSNIGHAEAAAGIAQLSKTVLQLQHKTLVASLLHDRLNPNIDFAQTAFYVQQATSEWVQPQSQDQPYPRYAGISSFGAGGVNVHVIVGEAPPMRPSTLPVQEGKHLVFPLSAHQPEQRRQLAADLHRWLSEMPDTDWSLEEIAYSLQTRKALFPHRLAFVAADRAELLAALNRYVASDHHASASSIAATGRWYASAGQGTDFGLNFAEEEDLHYLQRLLAKGRADRLASLWAQGAHIPWESLYAGAPPPRCVPLPTYPFARKRYWVEGGSGQRAAGIRLPAAADGMRVLNDALFDVCWCDRPLDPAGDQAGIKLDTLLIVAEEVSALLSRRWGTATARRCLIGGGASASDGSHDAHVDATTLDFGVLNDQIDLSNIDALVYVSSPVAVEMTGHALEERLRHETRKLQRWMDFVITHLAAIPTRLVFLSVSQQGQRDAVQELLSKYFSFLRSEYSELQVSLIQISDFGEATLAQVHADIKYPTGEMEIAYQNGNRQVQRLVPLGSPLATAPFDPSGCMVITGGFGGIGLKLLQWLVAKGVQELVVIGRKPLTHLVQHPDFNGPLALEALIDRFRAQGVRLHYLCVDVGKPDSFVPAFQALRKDLEGPITGVFHLAGATTDAISLSKTTEAHLLDLVRPKLLGAQALDGMTAEDPIRYFCLFSSTSAIDGLQVSGLAAYAAANASMHAIAERRRHDGRPVQLIHWTDWDDVGMAVAHGHKRFMDAVGIRMLSPETGLAILESVLTGSIPISTVFDVDWQKFSEVNGFVRRLPFFAEFVRVMEERFTRASMGCKVATLAPRFDAVQPSGNEAQAAKGGASRPSSSPMAADKLLNHLATKMAAMLEVETIPPDENLADIGLDSINSLQYFKELSAELALEISPSVTFRYPTLSKLAAYLAPRVTGQALNALRAVDADDAGDSTVHPLQAALQRSQALLQITV